MTSKCKRYCSVPQCKQYKDTNVSIHSFPKDPKLCKVWQNILKIGKPITKYMSVCSRHFVVTDYKGKWNPNAKVHFLRPDAIPSKNLPITSHQNVKPVINRSKRKIFNKNESDNYKEGGSDELVYHNQDETFARKENVEDFRENVVSSIAEAERPTTSSRILHYREPLHKVEFANKQTQSNIVTPIENFLDTEKKYISFTGVGSDVIDTCVICINEIVRANNGQCITDIRKRVVFVLTKLKLNISFACLAVMFDFSTSSCTKYFYTTLHLLALALKPVIYWPTKDQVISNMPRCFEKYKSTRVVLDCTEIAVQKCKCLKCRIRTYSHYKGTHTSKLLMGITPAGTISFVSSAFGGRATDKAIFLKENILSKCDPHDAIMVDKGFMIENECAENYIQLIRPPFLKKKAQFSKEEAEQTADIARARVHVERAIQRIKLFNILNNQIEWFIIPHINDVMIVVCALVNLSPPILAGNKFENCIDEVVADNTNIADSDTTEN